MLRRAGATVVTALAWTSWATAAVTAAPCTVLGGGGGAATIAVHVGPDGAAVCPASSASSSASCWVRAARTTLAAAAAAAAPAVQTTVVERGGAAASCAIRRNYTVRGIWTEETWSAHDDGIEWIFRAGSSDGGQRRHIQVAQTLEVPQWTRRGMRWWLPRTSPSDYGTPPAPNAAAPFSPVVSLEHRVYAYGGYKFALNTTTGLPAHTGLPVVAGLDDGFVLPVLSFLGNSPGGLSFLEQPHSDTTYADIAISQAVADDAGQFVWTRRLLGVGGMARPVQLAGLLAVHENCWRPALGVFWQTWRKFALPHPQVDLARTEGAATYAYFFNQPNTHANDPAFYQQMDLAVNWDASFPWLYHGAWIPFDNDRGYFPLAATPAPAPAHDNAGGGVFRWKNCDPAGHGGHAIRSSHPDWPMCMDQSDALLTSWYKRLHTVFNVSTLVYGTLEEFGIGISTGPGAIDGDVPACDRAAENYTASLVCGANRLFQDRFPESYLVDPSTHRPVQAAWQSVIVDFADAAYTAFLLNNTRHVIDSFGADVAGVCLDRGDYIGLLNVKGGVDDGVSTTPAGEAGRALVRSWQQVVEKIAAQLHAASLALYANPDMGHRVDMYQHVDGFYSELGDVPPGKWRTGTAWLASGGKHAAIWCHGQGDPESQCAALMTNGTDTVRDRFLQSHLLLGVYPTVPFPDNDHALLPRPRADQVYQDYGSLFHAMHGKRWSTAPHAVSISDPTSTTAAVNMFELHPFGGGAFVVAVVWSNTSTVDLVFGNATSIGVGTECRVLHPGIQDRAHHDSCTVNGNGELQGLRLVRGAALVELREKGGRRYLEGNR